MIIIIISPTTNSKGKELFIRHIATAEDVIATSEEEAAEEIAAVQYQSTEYINIVTKRILEVLDSVDAFLCWWYCKTLPVISAQAEHCTTGTVYEILIRCCSVYNKIVLLTK